jgi:DNA replication factor GINS
LRVDAVIYRPLDTHGVPPEEDVNFERVTKVYREESGKKTLVNLEADFYDHLAAYVAHLDEAANAEAQKDPNSPKALLLQDELRKVRKRRDQIFTYRERKLALLASSRASGAEVEVPHLTTQERALFDSMVALLKKSRADAFGAAGHAALETPPSPEEAQAAPPDSAKPKAPERMKVIRAENTKRTTTPPTLKDHVLVHVLEDLPPFAGIDTTYRLKKEDVVTLPKTIAQILVDRGKARIVQMAGGMG